MSTHIKEEYKGDKKDSGMSKPVPPILRFLYLIIAPVNGWKAIKHEGYKPDTVASGLFYPLLALMAASAFMAKVYQPDLNISIILQNAIAEFVALFIGYFAIILLAKLILPGKAKYKIETDFGRVFVMMALSGLSLAVTLYSLFPNLGALLFVIPIYIAYLIAKGVRFLRVPQEHQIPSIAVLIVLTIGLPTGFYLLLTSLMPSV